MSTLSIKSGSKKAEFTATAGPSGLMAKNLCAALLRESEKSASHKSGVEKYVGELATLLGGSYTPS